MLTHNRLGKWTAPWLILALCAPAVPQDGAACPWCAPSSSCLLQPDGVCIMNGVVLCIAFLFASHQSCVSVCVCVCYSLPTDRKTSRAALQLLRGCLAPLFLLCSWFAVFVMCVCVCVCVCVPMCVCVCVCVTQLGWPTNQKGKLCRLYVIGKAKSPWAGKR